MTGLPALYRKLKMPVPRREPLDPRVITAAGKHPLPGEADWLTYDPDNTQPIDDDAALGTLRRREHQKLIKIYDGDPTPDALANAGLPPTLDEALQPSGDHVSAALPSWGAKKTVWTTTMSPRLLALVAAIAEQEGRSQALMFEMLLWQKVQAPPEDPAKVRQDYAEMMRQTVLSEREAKQGSEFG